MVEQLDNVKVNQIISYILKELRIDTRRAIELQQIIRQFRLKNVKYLIEKLKTNLKLNYDSQNQLISLKKNVVNNKEVKRNILTKEDFLQVLKDTPEGIEEDKNLYDCYKQIEQDIQQMKKSQTIRFVEPKIKQEKTILFYKNLEFDIKELKSVIDQSLFLILLKVNERIQLKARIQNMKRIVVLALEPKDKEKNRKKRRKQFFGRIYNKWMKDKIDFSEVEKAQLEEIKESYNLMKKKKLQSGNSEPIAAVLAQKAHNKFERYQIVDHLFHQHKILSEQDKKNQP